MVYPQARAGTLCESLDTVTEASHMSPSPMNPYIARNGCPHCASGQRSIFNIGYPAGHDLHEIVLCERHYRQSVEAARNYALTFRDDMETPYPWFAGQG
jgi:hypothetical protein